MSTPRAWMQEVRLRLEDARFLLERNRAAHAVSAAYYAFHAAAKGLLLSKDVNVTSHAGLRNRLGLHFVRGGRLPADTTKALYRLESNRAAADYDLHPFLAEDVRQQIDEVESHLAAMEQLL